MDNTQNQQQNAVVPAANEKGKVTYIVAGQEVKLSYMIVRNFLTKGNANVTDADLTQFISICKYNQLNPFLGEAFLIKYGDQPAQMVVTKEALMKRAEANEHYQGMKAGIIVKQADGSIDYREGTFFMEDEKLVGGWAEVTRDDRKQTFVSRVNLREYNLGKSIWLSKPSTMIRKVAIVQALREAFPAQLGAMYTPEEKGITEDAQFIEIKDNVEDVVSNNANSQQIGFEDEKKVVEENKPAFVPSSPANQPRKSPGF